jgi:class 3 adenylate cyclase
MNRRVYRLDGVERRHARENPGYQFRQEQRFAPPRGEMPRRLAAIVAGDIADYSRLMELDEEGTHLRVKRIQRDLVEPSIAEHHGRLVKTTGDGFFAIFDSPSRPCGRRSDIQSIGPLGAPCCARACFAGLRYRSDGRLCRPVGRRLLAQELSRRAIGRLRVGRGRLSIACHSFGIMEE